MQYSAFHCSAIFTMLSLASLVILFSMGVEGNSVSGKYEFVKNERKDSGTRLASLAEIPYIEATANLYQADARCYQWGTTLTRYLGDLPVVARYIKASEPFCMQLCFRAQCTGYNYYYNEEKCEVLKLPSYNYRISLISSTQNSVFKTSIYCYGLTTQSAVTTPTTKIVSTTTQTSGPITTTVGTSEIDDPNICGKVALKYQSKQSTFVQRIVGGNAASPHTRPWQVSMVVFGTDGRAGLCGGTLIHRSFVLTAAHCLQKSISKIRITTGDHDLYKSDEGQQQFEATVYRNHELYSGLTHANDVALVKLPKPAILNNTTRLACLPSEEVSAGTRCSISGWGTLTSGGETSDILQEAFVPIVDMTVCNDASHYGGSLKSPVMICAGYTTGGVDTCQGDSGGPLACQKDGKWEVQGVVSFGKGCANAAFPGVYAKVAPFRDWIIKTMDSI